MRIEGQAGQKLEEAMDILREFGTPLEQQNERTAYCLLALLNVTPEREWKNAESPLVGITPMMAFAKDYYNKEYAPNTRETFRRFSAHQMIQAGMVLYNPDKPDRPVNSPKVVYQISPSALNVIKSNRWLLDSYQIARLCMSAMLVRNGAMMTRNLQEIYCSMSKSMERCLTWFCMPRTRDGLYL